MNKRRYRKAVKRISNLPGGKIFFKYLLNKWRHILYKISGSTAVAYPSTVMIELTNHCNLACTTCPREYDYGKAMDKGFMDKKQAIRIIDELWPYLDSIGLTGMGETFLSNELEEIVGYIKTKSKGIIISVSTNAVLPDFVKKASGLINRIDTIQISIDGLGDVYEQIRLNARFSQLDENIRILSGLCKNSDTDLMLNMVVTKENYHQMSALVKYARETGIKYLDFTIFNLAAVTNLDIEYYDFFQSGEFRHAISELDKEIKRTPEVKVTNRNFKGTNNFQKCPFPWTHFYICWNGFVPPCCAKPFPREMNFGNVFGNKVMEVLNSDGFKRFRDDWYSNTTPQFCKKCHFIGLKPISFRG